MHSQNFLKQIILKFQSKHLVHQVILDSDKNTQISKLNSNYKDNRLLSIFSDNEARLFFSSFILFVEGNSEFQMLSTPLLSEKFSFLLDVDIYAYASHNVLSEGMNPSQTNTAIPYLFLFDADKAYDYNYKPTCTVGLKNTINIVDFKPVGIATKLSYYGRGFSKEYKGKRSSLLKIKSIDGEPFYHHKTLLTPKKPSVVETLLQNINHVLERDFVHILPTTYEGLLINNDSSRLFFQWLDKEIGAPINTILTEIQSRKMFNEKMLVQYLRIIFGGKSESLLNEKMLTAQNINGAEPMSSKRAKFLYNKLKTALKLPKGLTKKTSGWASRFLTFAILEIEKESATTEKPFRYLFSVYFPEFFDILLRLQSGSRGGR
jgi:hypothetical protein